MTDAILAHVRFSDHVARCPVCVRPAAKFVTVDLCDTGRELLDAWQRAEEASTRAAEEYDRARSVPDATGYDLDDCVEADAPPTRET